MYNIIARHILAPAVDLFRGTKTMKCLRELEESQWWSRDEILELQNRRLGQLVKHAYTNVPYYRYIFDERALRPDSIESGEELVKLPVLTKKLIRNNFDNLMARDFPSKEILPNSTGGSTGEPLRFYSAKNEWCNWGFAAALRVFGWAGYRNGDKCVLVSSRRSYQSTLQRIGDIAVRFFERVVQFDDKEMSTESMAVLARKLEFFQPEFIRGYPNAIYLLARFIQKKGGQRIRLRAIITTSEQLLDYQRDVFREVFGCETYSQYASWEMHDIAAECSEHSGYHIAAENVIVEIVDDKGKPVPEGEEGRILVTNLHNYVMPFIRYDIGDIGAISGQNCPCGRGLPLLARLNGRTTDVIVTKNEKYITAMALSWRFLPYLGVEQIQIVQESYGKVVAKLVLESQHSQSRLDQITKEIVGHWRPQLGQDMEITVESVDQIPLTRSGKKRMVISNLPLRSEMESIS